MESFLKDKKINIAFFVLLIVVSLLALTKLMTELNNVSISQSENTITVSGGGEVTAVSDIATIDVHLTKDGKTAKEAQDSLNEVINKTLNYLKTENILDKDIKSEYGGISPKYSYEKVICYTYPCPSNEPKIIGYTATQSITVKVREVDNASIVRTGLAELGISNINGPTFSIDDEETLKDQARERAIDNAKKKAEVLADQLGVKLGKVVNFSENSADYLRYEARNESISYKTMDASGSAPFLPLGENKIKSNVVIVYEIK